MLRTVWAEIGAATSAAQASRPAAVRARRGWRDMATPSGTVQAAGEAGGVPDGDDEAYALRLMEEGIVVAPGSSFGAGGEDYVRVALVPDIGQCLRAIERWGAALC